MVPHLFKTGYLLKNTFKITKVVRALREIDFLPRKIDYRYIHMLSEMKLFVPCSMLRRANRTLCGNYCWRRNEPRKVLFRHQVWYSLLKLFCNSMWLGLRKNKCPWLARQNFRCSDRSRCSKNFLGPNWILRRREQKFHFQFAPQEPQNWKK